MKIRKTIFGLILATLISIVASDASAQRGQRNRGAAMDVPEHPQDVGESGIDWYTTWKSGLAEAKRSNRPIFFMSAATVCSGVSGVF